LRHLAHESGRCDRGSLARGYKQSDEEGANDNTPRRHRVTIRLHRFSTMRATTGSKLIIRVK
jgi:hypothetical protein